MNGVSDSAMTHQAIEKNNDIVDKRKNSISLFQGKLLTSCATRIPDSMAPCIQPCGSEVWAPAK